VSLTESRRLSAREAAKPLPMQRYSKDIQAERRTTQRYSKDIEATKAATDAGTEKT